MRMLMIFMIILPNFANGQLILAEFKDECIVWSEPNIDSKRLVTLLEGDSCIVVQYLKPSVGAVWAKIVSADTSGYVMASFLKFPDGALYTLIQEKNAHEREEAAKQFIEYRRIEWVQSRIRKQQEFAKQQVEKEKEEKKRKIEEETKLKSIRTELSKYSALITHYKFDYPSNSYYPDFAVTIMNCNQTKTIKYVWFNITTYNPVHDVVASKTVRGIGPIKPFNSGSYNFDAVVISKVVEYGKINSIRIQYMDGTILTMTGKQLEDNSKKAQNILLKYQEDTHL